MVLLKLNSDTIIFLKGCDFTRRGKMLLEQEEEVTEWKYFVQLVHATIQRQS